ncbi:MAG TPA: anti-sigma factor [Acidimicrobiia bacterium]|nr:anti-sigma factor [Acidimicrobiia bacterium]
MDPELSDQEMEDLLAAYAIDAVDDDERALVERYLATHPDAAAEVQSFRHAAAFLAYTGGPVPDGVWDSLAPALADRRRRVEAAAGVVPLPSRRPQSEPMPDSPTVRGARRGRWLAAAAVAAIVAAGAAVAVVVADSGSGPSRYDELAAAARAARREPGAREVTLASSEGTALAHVVLLRDGRAYLSSDLPALEAGRTYQLWALRDGEQPRSLGVIGRDPRVVAFEIRGGASGIAVTDEVAGGVTVTHNAPVAAGTIHTA